MRGRVLPAVAARAELVQPRRGHRTITLTIKETRGVAPLSSRASGVAELSFPCTGQDPSGMEGACCRYIGPVHATPVSQS